MYEFLVLSMGHCEFADPCCTDAYGIFVLPFLVLQQSVSYFGSILSYVIIAIPIFMGDYDHLPPGDIAVVISKASHH